MTTEVRVPRTFYLDHISRDCPPGEVLSTNSRTVFVRFTHDELDDLRSDAAYYADPSTRSLMGSEYRGLCQSAAATIRAIDKTIESEGTGNGVR